MAQQDKLTFEGTFNNVTTGLFKDNTTGGIGADDSRTLVKNTTDSVPFTLDDSYTWPFPQVTATGTDTYAATLSPAITAYALGQKFQILFTNANTGAATLNLNAVGALAITKNGATALAAGDIAAGSIKMLAYDGTRLQLIGSKDSSTGVTRDFDRAFSSELLFDKNEIEYAEHTLTADLEYTVAGSGHLTNQFSSAVQRVVTDGTHAVTFTGYNFVLGDIQSGSVPDAGTYLVLFLYWNGVATVNWTQPSLEVANLTPLAAPGSFAAVPNGDNQIDLSWVDVANESSYHIDYSVTSDSGPWISLTDPAAGATAYSHTGLAAGTTYYYRNRAIGDLETYANSQYATAATTTTSSGDATPPTFTFNPTNAATDIAVNAVIEITANEAIQKADGTEITDANIGDVTDVQEDDGSGANIGYSGTIGPAKLVAALTPALIWGANQDVFVEIFGVEDNNGNEVAGPSSVTFTTGTYTEMLSNYLSFASDLDSYIVGNDKKFEIEVTFRNSPTTGQRTFSSKWLDTGNQRSYAFTSNGTNISFKIYQDGTDVHHTREIKWTGVLADSNEHTIRLVYDGTVDTNNGLDRADLYIDTVLQGSKSLIAFDDAIAGSVWPFGIFAGTAPVKFFRVAAQMKDLVFRADVGAGMVDIVDVPIIRTGEDVSGNNIDGTWV